MKQRQDFYRSHPEAGECRSIDNLHSMDGHGQVESHVTSSASANTRTWRSSYTRMIPDTFSATCLYHVHLTFKTVLVFSRMFMLLYITTSDVSHLHAHTLKYLPMMLCWCVTITPHSISDITPTITSLSTAVFYEYWEANIVCVFFILFAYWYTSLTHFVTDTTPEVTRRSASVLQWLLGTNRMSRQKRSSMHRIKTSALFCSSAQSKLLNKEYIHHIENASISIFMLPVKLYTSKDNIVFLLDDQMEMISFYKISIKHHVTNQPLFVAVFVPFVMLISLRNSIFLFK